MNELKLNCELAIKHLTTKDFIAFNFRLSEIWKIMLSPIYTIEINKKAELCYCELTELLEAVND